MAAPIKPTIAKTEPMAPLFFRKEVPELEPVSELPSEDELAPEMLTVELK